MNYKNLMKKDLTGIDVTEQYFIYQEEMTKVFGNKTIVFMEIGKFFESYSINILNKKRGYNLNEISKIIGVIKSSKDKNKSKIDANITYFVGFPINSLVDKLQLLTENGFTVVIIRQKTFPPEKVLREITGIYTPGTNILSYTSDVSYIVSLYLKEDVVISGKLKSLELTIGMSAYDPTTGKVYVHEVTSPCNSDKICLDSVMKFIYTYYPKELLIHINSTEISYNIIEEYLDLSNTSIKRIDDLDKNYFKLDYQIEVIKKIYPKHGLLNPIEYINLERLPYCMISFMTLLGYINLFNSEILTKIDIPKHFSSNEQFQLENNANIQLSTFVNNQLDTGRKKIRCLFDIVDNTSTPMGKRYLKQILNIPFTSKNKLENIYDIVSFLRTAKIAKKETKEKKPYVSFMDLLSSIGDVEKIFRKITMNINDNIDAYIIIQSFTKIKKIIDLIRKIELDELLAIPKSSDKISNFLSDCSDIFDIEKLKNNNDKSNEIISYFNKGIHSDIDELCDNIEHRIHFIDDLSEQLNIILSKNKKNAKNMITKKYNDREGHILCLTKIRADLLTEELKKIKEIKVGKVKIPTVSMTLKKISEKTFKIIIPEFSTNSNDLSELQNNLNKLIKKYFEMDWKNIIQKYNKTIKSAIIFITKLDYYVSNAKTSVLYQYEKPIIDEQEYGYIECEQLRHPIIERIIEHEYIPHDICIGKELKGMLLYGLNSSGKSSIMKAIGLSLIMAQCGMFVPAKKFTYSPYNKLYTRISGGDNLFRELSSFSVEMVELKSIWENSDSKTLVIGDEVCRGTEHISGNAIVAATLIKLSKQNSSFIFATHLHEIVKLPRIKAIKNIKSFYISVTHDEKNDKLIFDRQLKEGNGEEIYGITVAKYIIQNSEFLELANEIKNELLGIDGNIVQTKKSNYNSSIYVNECNLCTKKLQTIDECVNLDTHHINHQKNCSDGIVNDKKYIKKNDKCNLIVLCKSCHNKVHNGEINLDKYVMTSDGKKLLHK